MRRYILIPLFLLSSFSCGQSVVNSGFGDAVGSGSSIAISSPMSLTAGNSAIAFCRTGGAAGVTFTITDNAGGNTWVGIGLQNDANVGNTEFFYISNISTGGASITVTCNFSTSESNSAIVVIQTTPFSTIDVSTHNTFTSAATLVSSTYSTTHANEFIFLCGAQANITPNTFGGTAGDFGGVTATTLVYDTSQGYAACQSVVLVSTQTSQTARLNASQTHAWNYALASFQVSKGSAQPCIFVICD